MSGKRTKEILKKMINLKYKLITNHSEKIKRNVLKSAERPWPLGTKMTQTIK